MQVLLAAHVITGTLAVVAGALILILKKGDTRHQKIGRFYFWMMSAMALSGGLVAVFLPQAINVLVALLIAYMVISARQAVSVTRNRDKRAHRALTGVSLSLLVIAVALVYTAANAPGGQLHGFHYTDYAFILTITALCAFGDMKLLVKAPASARSNRVRHIWRMMFSYFVAVGSLFTGPGASVFPQWLQASGLLSLPELCVFLLMCFWIARALRAGRAQRQRSVHS